MATLNLYEYAHRVAENLLHLGSSSPDTGNQIEPEHTGPAKVAAHLLKFGLLRNVHPLVSARIAASLHPLGALIFGVIGAPAAAAFGILHGAGNGILAISKGTLPLVIFEPGDYGYRQGVLMAPARIAQTLAPWLFGICLNEF